MNKKTMRLPHLSSTALLLLVALCVGCGGMPATVTGKVTVGGKSYEALRVSFVPEAGGATVSGKTDAEGHYTLKTGKQTGLSPGEYRVTVTGFSKTPSPTMSKAEVDALRIIPEASSNRDTTPHRATVSPGSNEVNLDL